VIEIIIIMTYFDKAIAFSPSEQCA